MNNITDKRKVIKVEVQKEITTYLNYSLPLNVFLWDKKQEQWLYEHFTNIYVIREDNDNVWLDYLEEVKFPEDIMEYKFYNVEEMEKISDIVEYVIQNIENGYVCLVFADKYFISNESKYREKHEAVQLFLHGYDSKKQTFYGVGFDKSRIYRQLEYKFEEIKEAYEYLFSKMPEEEIYIWAKLYTVTLMKYEGNNVKFLASKDKIMKQIEEYYYCDNQDEALRPEIKVSRGHNATYGIKAQYVIVAALKELLDGKFNIDYRAFHLLAEQKRLLYKKLLYLASICFVNEKEVREYKEIYIKMEHLRRMYLYTVLKENGAKGIYEKLHSKEVINMLVEGLIVVINQELLVLREILNENMEE